MKFSGFSKKEKIKALIYIDDKNNVATCYRNFDFIKEKHNEVIEVYYPDMAQRKMIIELLNGSLNSDKKELSAGIEDIAVFDLIGELTNIKLDLDKDKDKELINNILKDPSDVLLAVKDEIEVIVNSLFRRLYNAFLEFSKNPKELRDNMLEIMQKIEIEEVKMSEEELKLEALKEQVKELEKKISSEEK